MLALAHLFSGGFFASSKGIDAEEEGLVMTKMLYIFIIDAVKQD